MLMAMLFYGFAGGVGVGIGGGIGGGGGRRKRGVRRCRRVSHVGNNNGGGGCSVC